MIAAEEFSDSTCIQAGMCAKTNQRHTVLRALSRGLITGAADDDCSAIGTYAQAGAQLGYEVLWATPFTFPMMVAVVYLSSKLGQVTGQGLFTVLRNHAPRWLVYLILAAAIFGNVVEAGADIGGMVTALSARTSDDVGLLPPYNHLGRNHHRTS